MLDGFSTCCSKEVLNPTQRQKLSQRDKDKIEIEKERVGERERNGC